ncbi:SLOG family protein [Pediococcus claussenii]|uniref:UPF0398 protein PECL_1015 n=1 Tax=Pediococcus claussenii (strain ATCC BAA-344 / DSM 14800 / JCM 18046 / KCTC 3811 / LMG 21948 / P06) TaxID=701521 RepID=G8PDE8_PEDCP|nr:DUF1273 domain-containing protein [Pediococcus claussenii]AEV95283.1 hypothetical protein PECL_1015 [Pediococcus claussenii ATCC BAA-344]ANZ68818.1 hypothetical protein AYR57_00120 [Pediococcus claussenii]ANZ70634.1 hypothetical protein AYR58_00120 [Pediococcus claussenii]KRN19535.1 hypothetical protein IV79_GL001252 [Pediococcus claussenii]
MSRVWVTGYRSYELGVFDDKDPKLQVIKFALKQKLLNIINEGAEWILTGPQMGVEQWTVATVKSLKEEYPELKVAMMFPFTEFGSQWNESNQGKLQEAKIQADFSDFVSNKPYQSPEQLRNYQSFMLGHTDRLLMVYDEERPGKSQYDFDAALKFAEQHDYPIDLLDFYDLEEFANEYQELDK